MTVDEHVRRLVDAALPLTSEQRDRIAALLVAGNGRGPRSSPTAGPETTVDRLSGRKAGHGPG